MSYGGDVIPKGYKKGRIQQYTPEQMELFQSLFANVGPDSYLAQIAGGSPEAFEQLERPALKQFGQMQAGTASRFAGMGKGALKSSGFQNVQSQAAADFGSQLQSQRINLQQQALHELMNMSQQLLSNRPYEQFLTQKQQSPNWYSQLAAGALPIAGAGLGYAAGGWPGAKVGGAVGSAAAKGFM